MVLALLAVVWIAVLAPPLLRRGAESRRADSITDFRRQLGVLQRTGPKVIAPAHSRLEGVPAVPAGNALLGAAGRSARVSPTRTPAPHSRTLQRRRNVLFGLSGSTAAFLLLGLVPHLHTLLALAALSGVLLAAYVAMLVRMRNVAAEREMKLTFLPGAAAAEGTVLLRRSAN
ncbi:MAG TPA: hypothetical protein VFA11_05100 [Acidimicrobiales bacterium]|nr:hypothetical protein [Acidimicrobiales bacterium]